ncbi:DUF6415 family natural product biosynthesis protein [Streptomyces sp. bgisy034]|uniref:DUF6415 family natural product biosynthesis protein n=1 Tax=Streptomyces sp. bgisy034 TaxID=3413774 RepID=UPI003EB8F534
MEDTTDATALPADVATMRDTVNRLLDPDGAADALPPTGEELQTLTDTLRGHLEVIAPEVEQAARALAPGAVRHSVLGCTWEARSRLEAQPSSRTGGPVAYARRLARALNALCDHYERFVIGAETAERASRRRLGEHVVQCETCTRRDGTTGANLGLSCAEGDRLYGEMRKASSGHITPSRA